MERCDWCGREAELHRVELLVRGLISRIAAFRLCKHCLSQAED